MEGPLVYRFHDGAMVPLPKFARAAHERYEPEETYALDEFHARSKKSHDHYFVMVEEAHANLPEIYAGRWATPDHLRKWALIRCGYHDERSLVCASKAEALRVAAFLRPIDEYAVVTVSEAVVIAYTAKSQKMRAMGKVKFQESKTAVLELLASMLDVTPAQLQHERVG